MNANEDLSSAVWKLDLPATPWDAMTSGYSSSGLSEMVRGEYQHAMRATLLANLNGTGSAATFGSHTEAELLYCVDKSMAEIEKYALRSCMMSAVYSEAMSSMINQIKKCTENSTTHGSLTYASSMASAAVSSAAPSDRSEDQSATARDLNDDECNRRTEIESQDNAMSTVSVTHIHRIGRQSRVSKAFDSQDDRHVLELAVDIFKRTGIRPESDAIAVVAPDRTAACTASNPTVAAAVIERPERIAETLADLRKATDVAHAHEFRRRMEKLHPDSRARLDAQLDRLLGPESRAATERVLSAHEQWVVSRNRIALVVTKRLDMFYDVSRISRTMFSRVAELLTVKLLNRVSDIDSNEVIDEVDKLFTSETYMIADFDDINPDSVIFCS